MSHTKKIIFCIVFFSSISTDFFLYAQNTPQKLPATQIIGTLLSVDYTDNNPSQVNR
jgi:hypothetical protein